MAGFDESVLNKPLGAAEKKKKPGAWTWVSEKVDTICCYFKGCKK